MCWRRRGRRATKPDFFGFGLIFMKKGGGIRVPSPNRFQLVSSGSGLSSVRFGMKSPHHASRYLAIGSTFSVVYNLSSGGLYHIGGVRFMLELGKYIIL